VNFGVCQIDVMTGYRLDSIMFDCGVCQIDVMIGYRLDTIRFELWCVSD
jgi:hypothetical protein